MSLIASTTVNLVTVLVILGIICALVFIFSRFRGP